jgi:hypothetical protein
MDRMRVLSTWYGGDPDKLSNLYWDAVGDASEKHGVVNRLYSSVRRWFWGTAPVPGEKNSKIHVDLAKDIATISSELLFSEPPLVKVQAPMSERLDEQGEIIMEESESARRTQERLDQLLDATNWNSLLLAAAETSAALGCTGLRIAWDSEVSDMPFLTRVDADAILPEYRWGRLVAVTFWRQWVSGGTVWRHLERHERGRIYHGLYEGGLDNLGIAIPLNAHPDTAYLVDMVDAESSIAVPEGYRTATSIPNMLPDPLDRQNNAGRSDFTPGVLSLFDAIDETYTSLMRDIELAKGRLIVAQYMLEDNGPGKGSTFNPDRKIMSPLKISPSESGDAPITVVQFQIRVQEHLQTIEHLTSRAVKSAGYNPQTMGDAADGAAMTATEVTSRERRSLSTRDKKIQYWKNELEALLEALLAVDRDVFNSGIEVFPVTVEWPDAVQPDLKMLSETVELMKRAEASSLKVRIETLHPDWDEADIEEEIARIQEETSVIDPLTFGLAGNQLEGDYSEGQVVDEFQGVRNGDLVQMPDGRTGRVEHIMTGGTLGIPGSSFAIQTSPTDPGMTVRIVENGADTDMLTNVRFSDVTPL